MKLIKKVKAFFFHKDDPVELDLIAAEIKEGKAYLHPRDEEKVTYLVKSDDIKIHLNNGRTLSQKDIIKIAPKPQAEDQSSSTKQNKEKLPSASPRKTTTPVFVQDIAPNEFDRFKKRTFSVTLYQEDYDALISSMKGYGYKRADFVMACVNSASKTTMECAHKKIQKVNKARKIEQEALVTQHASTKI